MGKGGSDSRVVRFLHMFALPNEPVSFCENTHRTEESATHRKAGQRLHQPDPRHLVKIEPLDLHGTVVSVRHGKPNKVARDRPAMVGTTPLGRSAGRCRLCGPGRRRLYHPQRAMRNGNRPNKRLSNAFFFPKTEGRIKRVFFVKMVKIKWHLVALRLGRCR